MRRLVLLRYPGGKNRLLKYLSPQLDRVVSGQDTFCDLFAGGGSVTLHVARRFPQLRLHLNDLNPSIATFWKVIVGDECRRLIERVQDTVPTVELFRELRNAQPSDPVEVAYKTLYVNRCSFSGLGTSPLGGWSQGNEQEVGHRWNTERLCLALQAAHDLLANRTTVTQMNALDCLSASGSGGFFADPPYFMMGDELYPTSMSMAEHIELAKCLRCKGRWVLTYDDSAVIRSLYSWASCRAVDVAYSIRGHMQAWKRRQELIISPAALN